MSYGIDEVFSRIDGAGLSSLLVDGLGSTLALADASGAIQTQYTFEPFGATTTSGVASTNGVQFTGRENDATGLYYYRARYYSPRTARFIAEDPLYQTHVLPPSESLYTYVRNAPTGFIDPSGENAISITIPWLVPEIGIGAGLGIGAGIGGVMCAASPTCRLWFRCLWEYLKDFAKVQDSVSRYERTIRLPRPGGEEL